METIHLEAYPAMLRKQKIYCVGTVDVYDKMFYGLFSQYSEEMLRRHKVVVVFCDQYTKHQPKFLKNMFIDAIFRIRDNQDLRLAYTYIQHTSKPLIILWYGNEVPNQILQSKDDITLISGGLMPKDHYSSIFWHTKVAYEEIKDFISLKLHVDVKTILNETKASDVSLVWSSIGDPDKKGSLFWFDFNSVKNSNVINYTQACEYLRNLADALESKE